MAQAPKKILCIEDDRETAALIAQELTERGFTVQIAHTGQEGILSILQEPPDLLLCDIRLPTMSGFQVLERLNDLTPRIGRIPFMFVTALSDADSERKARHLGADDYIRKPIDFERLVFIINARLAGVARTKLLANIVMLNEPEIEVLTWVARGKTSAEIASKLNLSKRTVDFHVNNARNKLRATTRTEAAIKAAAGGLIDP